MCSTYLDEARDKKILDDISDYKIKKIISVLQDVQNTVLIIGIPDWESGFRVVNQENIIPFLIKNKFSFELAYTDCGINILMIKFSEVHTTKELSRYWSYYTNDKKFITLEIYLDYRDFLKLHELDDDIIKKAGEYYEVQ